MECQYVPTRLKLTSTIPLSKLATWKSPLYWGVQCLAHRQYSVSSKFVPNIPKENYIQVFTQSSAATPGSAVAEWNFCQNANGSNPNACPPETDFLLLSFTFKPGSPDYRDYELFVIDLTCSVTYKPPNAITDQTGQQIMLDIEKVTHAIDKSLVEVWLIQGKPGQGGVSVLSSALPVYRSSQNIDITWPLITGLSIFLILTFIMIFILKKQFIK